ncbi:hypothetical protein BpHYR1_030078 [Brachionus plicatilis]|uniref:Uncharacterized protein n=1 Tax=Brachionus plicatilis TaxID=10195 RepID=A0A3M7RDX0_BRAPC|nr:hypothetical protein BpHYR1_030078 [Brachionus plicatilis]
MKPSIKVIILTAFSNVMSKMTLLFSLVLFSLAIKVYILFSQRIVKYSLAKKVDFVGQINKSSN